VIQRVEHKTKVQARTDSAVYFSFMPTSLPRNQLSHPLSESEPEHPRAHSVIYKPVLHNADFIDVISTGETHRRFKN